MNKRSVVWCICLAAFAFALLSVFLPAGKVSAQDQASQACERCHAGAARDWARSKMANTMGCSTCHGSEHNKAENARMVKTPTPATCQKCHSKQVEQFASGKHAMGWKALEVGPNFAKLPAPVAQSGCIGCHQVGYVWADGSQGKCDSCHSRHSFSAAEANEPEACGTCHAGDHPQYEMWSNSKHGKLYQMTRDGSRAPKCQTCHMPSGNHKALTAWGFYGLRGEEADPRWKENRDLVAKMPMRLGPGKAPNVMRGSMDEWNTLRSEMVATCKNCHSESFAREQLAKGDAVIKATDAVTADIVRIVEGLLKDGLMNEATVNVLYRKILPHRMNAYIGAFHGSPEFVHEAGWQKLTQDLVKLKDEEKRLRKKTE